MKYLTAFYSLLVLIVTVIALTTYGPRVYKNWIDWRIEEGNEVEIRNLVNRFKSGDLKGEELNEKIDFALGVQSERNWNHPKYPEWNPVWGELIEEVHAAGLLSAEKWNSYASNSVDFRLVASSFLKQGKSIPACLQMFTRLGPSSRFRVEYQGEYYFLQDRSFKFVCFSEKMSQEITTGTYGKSFWFDLPLDDEYMSYLGNKPGYVNGTVNITVFDRLDKSGPPLVQRQIPINSQLNQLSTSNITQNLSYGLPDKSILEKGVKVDIYKSIKWKPNNLLLDFTSTGIPKAMTCNIWIRSKGKEWDVLSDHELKSGSGIRTQVDLLDFNSDKVDIVIRPSSPTDKIHTRIIPYDVNQYEVVIRNIPIQEFVIKKQYRNVQQGLRPALKPARSTSTTLQLRSNTCC